MGRMQRGILGGFVGKVGTVIGSQRNGMDIISSLPKKSSKAATQDQKDVRNKFGMAIAFMQPINQVLRLGFKSSDPRLSPINLAVSYFIKNAITGATDAYEIDYPNVLISKGELSPGWNTLATATDPQEVKIGWTNTTSSGLAQPDDEVLAVVYNASKGQHLMAIGGIMRSAGELVLEMPLDYTGDVVHSWLAFISKDKKLKSTSSYAGLVTIL